MGIDPGVPNAPPAEAGQWGAQAVEIDLSQSINTDTVAQDIRQFRPINAVVQRTNSPTIQNNGIIKDGGVGELWETVYSTIPNAIAGYVSSGGIGLVITTPDAGATIVYNRVTFSGTTATILPITTVYEPRQAPNNLNVFFQRYLVSGYFDATPIALGTAPTSALGVRISSSNVITIDEFDIITGQIYNTGNLTPPLVGIPTVAYLTRVGNGSDGQTNFATQISTYGIVISYGAISFFVNNSGNFNLNFGPVSGPAYFIPSSGTYIINTPASGLNLLTSTSPTTLWTTSGTIKGGILARSFSNTTNPLITTLSTSPNLTYQLSTTGVGTSIGILSTTAAPVVTTLHSISPYGCSGLATATGIANPQSFTTYITIALANNATSTYTPEYGCPMGSISVGSNTAFLNANSTNGQPGFLFFSSAALIPNTAGIGGAMGSSINEFGDLLGCTVTPSAFTNGISGNIITAYCPNNVSGSNKSTFVSYTRVDGSIVFVDIWSPLPSSGIGSVCGSAVTFNEISPNVVVVNDANGTIIDLNDRSKYLDVSIYTPMGTNNTIFGTGNLMQTGAYNKYSSSIYHAPFQLSASSIAFLNPFSTQIDVYEAPGSATPIYLASQVSAGAINYVNYKNGQQYVNQSLSPIVHTATYSGTIAKMLTTSAVQLPGYANYNIGNLIGSYIPPAFGGSSGRFISQGLTGFILFGYYYGFDGVNIYVLNLSGGSTGTLVGQPQILVKAQGLQFLNVTPTEAFFLSKFDNSLWIFNGGRSVEKVISMNQQAAIIAGYYDVYESALVVTTASGYLTMRDGIWTKNSYPAIFSGSVPQANATSQGIYWTFVDSSGNFRSVRRTYAEDAAAPPLPLNYQTSYLGPGNGGVIKIERIAMQVWCSKGLRADIQLTLNYKTTDNAGSNTSTTVTLWPSGTSQTGQLTIQTPGANADGYAWFDWIPSSKYGVATSVTIQNVTSTPIQKIAILDMIWYYTNDGYEPITGKVIGG